MRKKLFFSKVVQMVFSMITLNASGLIYNIFIANTLGAESVGLFYLVMGVYNIFVSFCVSAMGICTTRLVADHSSKKDGAAPDAIVQKCLKICTVTSVFSTVVMFFASDFIAKSFLHRPEAGMYIKILSSGLIAVSFSSVIGGCYTALGRVNRMSVGILFGEAVVWVVTLFFLHISPSDNRCMPMVYAIVISSFARCALDLVLWKGEKDACRKPGTDISCKSIITLCAPFALGSYLRTVFSGVENNLIPIKMSGSFSDNLSDYGIFKGMSMVLLTFPSVITGAFCSLVVPEMAKRFSQKRKNGVRYASQMSLEYILKFAFLVSGIFFLYSRQIADVFFSVKKAGEYLHLLSALPVFMYLDSVTDATLKGLNEQKYGLKINTADSFLRIALIVLLVPSGKIKAYIFVLYVSEIFNLSLSLWRLKKITALRFGFGRTVCLCLLSLSVCFFVSRLCLFENLFSNLLLFASVYTLCAELVLPSFLERIKR